MFSCPKSLAIFFDIDGGVLVVIENSLVMKVVPFTADIENGGDFGIVGKTWQDQILKDLSVGNVRKFV